MLAYPNINPIAFSIGPLPIHWYGLMYLISFLAGWALLKLRAKNPQRGFTPTQVSDLVFYTALGVIIGGRVGYIIFYDWSYFLSHPLFLFQTWKGGMSFHGGLIGVIIALGVYAKIQKKPIFELTDFIAPVIPVGLLAGRIGNFINGELWGRVTNSSWGMIFPNAGELPRHPSQLYEALLEGCVLFIILWIFSARLRARGAVSGLFLLLYGIFRFSLEFLREPDQQMGYLAFGWLTTGQLLSLPMILGGIILLAWAYRGKYICSNT